MRSRTHPQSPRGHGWRAGSAKAARSAWSGGSDTPALREQDGGRDERARTVDSRRTAPRGQPARDRKPGTASSTQSLSEAARAPSRRCSGVARAGLASRARDPRVRVGRVRRRARSGAARPPPAALSAGYPDPAPSPPLPSPSLWQQVDWPSPARRQGTQPARACVARRAEGRSATNRRPAGSPLARCTTLAALLVEDAIICCTLGAMLAQLQVLATGGRRTLATS